MWPDGAGKKSIFNLANQRKIIKNKFLVIFTIARSKDMSNGKPHTKKRTSVCFEIAGKIMDSYILMRNYTDLMVQISFGSDTTIQSKGRCPSLVELYFH